MSSWDRLNGVVAQRFSETIPAIVVSLITLAGASGFGLTLVLRPRAFDGVAFRINRDYAPVETWGWVIIGTALVYLLVLVVDPHAGWIPEGVALLVLSAWDILTTISTAGTEGPFPVASFILSLLFAALLLRRMHRGHAPDPGRA